MPGLLQSMLVGACLGITPALQRIPTAVVWGYFAYMALDSLPGSQFWDRLLLLLTDPKRRFRCGFASTCLFLRHAKTCLPSLQFQPPPRARFRDGRLLLRLLTGPKQAPLRTCPFNEHTKNSSCVAFGAARGASSGTGWCCSCWRNPKRRFMCLLDLPISQCNVAST